MSRARCQAVANTREIIEIKLDFHQLHNNLKSTEISIIDF